MVKGTCTYASDEESAERNYQRIRPYMGLMKPGWMYQTVEI